eukprot:gene2702-3353_t
MPIDRITVTNVNGIRLMLALLPRINLKNSIHLAIVISQQLNGHVPHNSLLYHQSVSDSLEGDGNVNTVDLSRHPIVNIYCNQTMKNVFSVDTDQPYYLKESVGSGGNSYFYLTPGNGSGNGDEDGSDESNGKITSFFKGLFSGQSQTIRKDLFESLVHSTQRMIRSLKFYHDNWESYYSQYLIAMIQNNSINSLDLCGNELTDSSVRSILDSLKNIKSLSELNLSKNQLSNDSMIQIGNIVKNNLFLTSINLTHNQITSNPIKPFLDNIRTNTFKKTIKIGWNRLDDLAGILFCRFLQTNEFLTHLNLGSNPDLSYETYFLLTEVLKNTKSLRSLKLSGNQLDQEEALAITSSFKVNNSVQKLSLCCCLLSPGATVSLSQSIHINTTLTSIDIRFNPITNTGGLALAEALSKNRTITYLNIGFCNLGQEVGLAMGESLSINSTLKQLFINNNQLGEQGIIGISQGLLINNSLVTLDIGSTCQDFESIGYNAILSLSDLLKVNQTLTNLSIYNCKLGQESITLLSQSLLKNYTLTQLNLSSNPIRLEGALSLTQVLLENQTLQWLNLNNTNIQKEGVLSIVESLKTNRSIRYIGLSHNTAELQIDIIGIKIYVDHAKTTIKNIDLQKKLIRFFLSNKIPHSLISIFDISTNYEKQKQIHTHCVKIPRYPYIEINGELWGEGLLVEDKKEEVLELVKDLINHNQSESTPIIDAFIKNTPLVDELINTKKQEEDSLQLGYIASGLNITEWLVFGLVRNIWNPWGSTSTTTTTTPTENNININSNSSDESSDENNSNESTIDTALPAIQDADFECEAIRTNWYGRNQIRIYRFTPSEYYRICDGTIKATLYYKDIKEVVLTDSKNLIIKIQNGEDQYIQALEKNVKKIIEIVTSRAYLKPDQENTWISNVLIHSPSC